MEKRRPIRFNPISSSDYEPPVNFWISGQRIAVFESFMSYCLSSSIGHHDIILIAVAENLFYCPDDRHVPLSRVAEEIDRLGLGFEFQLNNPPAIKVYWSDGCKMTFDPVYLIEPDSFDCLPNEDID